MHEVIYFCELLFMCPHNYSHDSHKLYYHINNKIYGMMVNVIVECHSLYLRMSYEPDKIPTNVSNAFACV